jgi:alpha-N-arabinofuranosidase
MKNARSRPLAHPLTRREFFDAGARGAIGAMAALAAGPAVRKDGGLSSAAVPFSRRLARSGRASRAALASSARIEILAGEPPIGTVSPLLYGHFTEHIGGVVYDGIWVGEDSPVPNIGGIRRELVDWLRRIRPGVIRWPGGCFADSYDWRDGVGPRSARPCRTNFWANAREMRAAPDGPQKYDPNEFGTNEFVRFCRLAGAEPYIAANVRGLTAADFDDWVDYCNAPRGKTSLADARAAGGDPDPFGVRYWGVGNESWGCGGNFTPEAYAAEFRRFVAWVPEHGLPLSFIASGPSGDDLEWTRRFFAKLTERDRGLLRTVFGWGLHYYCGTSGKGQAVDFTVDDWYDLLAKADAMGPLVEKQWAAMGEIDAAHRVKLVVDEWGAWHEAGTEIDPAFLFGQMPTMRDALIAALTLDTFNRHADKVAMANVAQLINNLHSLFLARGDRFCATPNFHVFEMYAAHQGGQSLRTVFTAPPVGEYAPGKTSPLWGLAGSASLHGRGLVVTAVNPSAKDALDVEVVLRGVSARDGRLRVLASGDIHDHNTFDDPRAVEPREVKIKARGDRFGVKLPPASVSLIEVAL